MIPVAEWPGHGQIVHDGTRLWFLPKTTKVPEPWPEAGATVREKVRRLLAGDRCRKDDGLVPSPGLGQEVAAELAFEQAAAEAGIVERERLRLLAERQELDRQVALQEATRPYLTGWKKGRVRVALNPKEADGATHQLLSGYLSKDGLFGIHRRIGSSDGTVQGQGWTLTHAPSGSACAHMDRQADLRVLAARLALSCSGYEEAAKGPSPAILARWATIAVPVRRTGNPLAAEDPTVKKTEKRVKKAPGAGR